MKKKLLIGAAVAAGLLSGGGVAAADPPPAPPPAPAPLCWTSTDDGWLHSQYVPCGWTYSSAGGWQKLPDGTP